MISYNSANRSVCLKIKKQLERFGWKVWIDVKDIHGSSLESMARAVEDASSVLICVTEKYRQSVNCQAEAQYAFKLNKHIIPLIMENGYEDVKGWLGIIMSDKIFINFTKYEFDECIRRLIKELRSFHMSQTDSPRSLNTSFGQPLPAIKTETVIIDRGNEPKPGSVENWSEIDVRRWLVANNIDQNVVDRLMPCTGADLKQLFDLKASNPQFYVHALNSKRIISDFKPVITFDQTLQKLFVSKDFDNS